jgi:hypothetical protein
MKVWTCLLNIILVRLPECTASSADLEVGTGLPIQYWTYR